MLVNACTWSTEQISPAHAEYIRGFKDTLEIRLDEELTLLAFHGSPRSYDDEIFSTTPDEELESMLAGHDATVFAGGHTHFQMFRRFGESLVINAGSVGQPFRRRQRGIMRLSPYAAYCLVRYERGSLAVDLRRTPVNLEALTSAVRSSGMPAAERWADLWSEPSAVN
jgi:diadenosine tetraphosphatase ApaH/serine/threonine PP2A family protein phosphatase